ncbi:MAG: amino acid ABC transporter permease [Candidatus Rokuibacteriota bacterium]
MAYQFQFEAIWPYAGLLVRGVWLTIQLTSLAAVLGIGLGVLGAMGRTSRFAWLRILVGTYVELIRNTPFIVQLFFVFFGLPSAGVKLTANEAAVLAMVINMGAYSIEIIRAGIEAIHRGQIEAGLALGLSRLQVFRHVVLFPALKAVYPALASQFILLMLATSVVSQIAAQELLYAAGFLESRTFRSFEIYLAATFIYLAMALLFRAAFQTINYYAFVRR